ncbi:hypothetical protein VQ042_17505 [Aurantimonas sp. A2-1-M11]|uniref:hypothetical protein n=1 Tax=Aurantimonas sp. A2-1-M11 TaxID=3113712 RepID=UPI002F91E186
MELVSAGASAVIVGVHRLADINCMVNARQLCSPHAPESVTTAIASLTRTGTKRPNMRWTYGFEQPHRRRADQCRQIEEQIGLPRGVAADGHINRAEVEFLQKWQAGNVAITDQPLVRTLYRRVNEILSVGSGDEDEKVELLDTLNRFCSRDFELGGVLKATTLPLCDPAPMPLAFEGLRYSFTGTLREAEGPGHDYRVLLDLSCGPALPVWVEEVLVDLWRGTKIHRRNFRQRRRPGPTQQASLGAKTTHCAEEHRSESPDNARDTNIRAHGPIVRIRCRPQARFHVVFAAPLI